MPSYGKTQINFLVNPINGCVRAYKSCLTLCMEHSLPGSSVHGIFQARILEWVVMPSSGDLPDPGIELEFPPSPALAGRFFTVEPPGKPQQMVKPLHFMPVAT